MTETYVVRGVPEETRARAKAAAAAAGKTAGAWLTEAIEHCAAEQGKRESGEIGRLRADGTRVKNAAENPGGKIGECLTCGYQTTNAQLPPPTVEQGGMLPSEACAILVQKLLDYVPDWGDRQSMERKFPPSKIRRLGAKPIGKRITKQTARKVAKKGKPEKVKRLPKTCGHGTRVGYNCWQCGGVAKVSE